MADIQETRALYDVQQAALNHYQAAWEEQEAALKSAGRSIERAWLAGRDFMEIKARMPHGGWGPWLEEHCIGQETARKWMKIAANMTREQAIESVSISAAFRAVSISVKPAAKIQPVGISDGDAGLRFAAGLIYRGQRERLNDADFSAWLASFGDVSADFWEGCAELTTP